MNRRRFPPVFQLPIKLQRKSARSSPNFSRPYVGLSDDQIRDIRSGKALAKTLDSPTADEVFVFGAVYVHSTPEQYLKLASDIDVLKKLPNYLAIRKFTDPPQLSDFDGFSLEEDDLKALQKCREGKCEIQLPTDAMDEFRAKVNWSAPDAADQANRIAKGLVLEALKRYQDGGNAALRDLSRQERSRRRRSGVSVARQQGESDAHLSSRIADLSAELSKGEKRAHPVRILLGEGQLRTEADDSIAASRSLSRRRFRRTGVCAGGQATLRQPLFPHRADLTICIRDDDGKATGNVSW